MSKSPIYTGISPNLFYVYSHFIIHCWHSLPRAPNSGRIHKSKESACGQNQNEAKFSIGYSCEHLCSWFGFICIIFFHYDTGKSGQCRNVETYTNEVDTNVSAIWIWYQNSGLDKQHPFVKNASSLSCLVIST